MGENGIRGSLVIVQVWSQANLVLVSSCKQSHRITQELLRIGHALFPTFEDTAVRVVEKSCIELAKAYDSKVER